MLNPLHLILLPEKLAICQADPSELEPNDFMFASFWSVTRTSTELSIVLPQDHVRPEWVCEPDWRALQVVGPLPFEMVGVVANLSQALAEAEISLFVLSTYETDYILLKEQNVAGARQALLAQGHIWE